VRRVKMADIYKAKIELEVGLLLETNRDTLVDRLGAARQTLIGALPAGSIITVFRISKWDELEKTVQVVERANKEAV